MFLDKNSKFPMDHRPFTSIYYVKDVGNGKASCVWNLRVRGSSIDDVSFDDYTGGTSSSTVNFLTDVSPEKIHPSLTINSKSKIIIENHMERGNSGGNFSETTSERIAMRLYLANPPTIKGKWSHMFHTVVIFTPKDGLFNETAPS